MDETIIFKLFTKREETGSLDKVPDALILSGDETEPGLPCLLHQHVLHHGFLLHFSLEGTISEMRHTHTSDLIHVSSEQHLPGAGGYIACFPHRARDIP